MHSTRKRACVLGWAGSVPSCSSMCQNSDQRCLMKRLRSTTERGLEPAQLPDASMKEFVPGTHHRINSHTFLKLQCKMFLNFLLIILRFLTRKVQSPALEQSLEAERLMGVKIPRNTLRNNSSDIRAFCKFSFTLIEQRSSYASFKDNLKAATVNSVVESIGKRFMETLFVRRKYDGSGFDKIGLFLLRHFLVEFRVHYKGNNNQEVAPKVMLGYINGIQRSLTNWGFEVRLLQDPIFKDKMSRLVSVLENRFSEQKAQERFL